jgi:DNA polymerase-3 subunit gamma/tau
MSYQVLARKYRPKSFETLVGQEHVVRALTHALEQKRLHHAYLFTGTRGVGKTTLSRILAKSFNCETGITAAPCGVCDACSAIDAGRFVDYIEMDAASNRGVDEMAQLLEQAIYAPSNARFKVYMIDEVHMLTNHAFNSMLKTLEEPPEHVKFILATTDPQKIPVTVLSRCLQFNLKQMPPGHIVGHLENILGQEDIAFDPPALRLLAQGAHGSMRDALSLTDQAIAYAAGKVTLEAVQGMLGALDQSYLIRVLDALAAKDGAGLLAVADEMATRSLSYNAALQDLGTLLHRIALAQTVPSAMPDDVPEREHIMRLASMFDAEEIQLFYQIAVHGRNELGLAPDEYAGFSMTLLRMLAFRPGTGAAEAKPAAPVAAPAAVRLQAAPQAVTNSAPVARPAGGMSPARAALEAARNAGKPQAGSLSQAAAKSAPPWEDEPSQARERPVAEPAAAQKKTESNLAPNSAVNSAANSASIPAANSAAPVARAPASSKRAPAPQPVPALNWDGNWPVLAAALPVRGVAQQLAQQSELMQCEINGEGAQFHLRIPLDTLRSAGSVDKLAAALSEHFGKTVRVQTELGAVELTANAQAQAEREERQREAEETLHNDPFVQTLMREFSATIVPGSIKPI